MVACLRPVKCPQGMHQTHWLPLQTYLCTRDCKSRLHAPDNRSDCHLRLACPTKGRFRWCNCQASVLVKSRLWMSWETSPIVALVANSPMIGNACALYKNQTISKFPHIGSFTLSVEAFVEVWCGLNHPVRLKFNPNSIPAN